MFVNVKICRSDYNLKCILFIEHKFFFFHTIYHPLRFWIFYLIGNEISRAKISMAKFYFGIGSRNAIKIMYNMWSVAQFKINWNWKLSCIHSIQISFLDNFLLNWLNVMWWNCLDEKKDNDIWNASTRIYTTIKCAQIAWW